MGILIVPAATGFPSAVLNAGHEINKVPPAGCPSARYTTSLTIVVAGPACNVAVKSKRPAMMPAQRHMYLRLLRAEQEKIFNCMDSRLKSF